MKRIDITILTDDELHALAKRIQKLLQQRNGPSRRQTHYPAETKAVLMTQVRDLIATGKSQRRACEELGLPLSTFVKWN